MQSRGQAGEIREAWREAEELDAICRVCVLRDQVLDGQGGFSRDVTQVAGPIANSIVACGGMLSHGPDSRVVANRDQDVPRSVYRYLITLNAIPHDRRHGCHDQLGIAARITYDLHHRRAGEAIDDTLKQSRTPGLVDCVANRADASLDLLGAERWCRRDCLAIPCDPNGHVATPTHARAARIR